MKTRLQYEQALRNTSTKRTKRTKKRRDSLPKKPQKCKTGKLCDGVCIPQEHKCEQDRINKVRGIMTALGVGAVTAGALAANHAYQSGRRDALRSVPKCKDGKLCNDVCIPKHYKCTPKHAKQVSGYRKNVAELDKQLNEHQKSENKNLMATVAGASLVGLPLLALGAAHFHHTHQPRQDIDNFNRAVAKGRKKRRGDATSEANSIAYLESFLEVISNYKRHG